MVKAVCVYNIDKVKKMSSKIRNRSMITTILLSIMLAFMGVYSCVTGLMDKEGIRWASVGLGALIALFSAYPVITTIGTNKKNLKETIKQMGLDKGELTLEFLIKEKKMEIKATQGEEIQTSTILNRNVTLVKRQKQGTGIYFGEDMYFIYDDEIIEGSVKELLHIYEKLDIKIKKR